MKLGVVLILSASVLFTASQLLAKDYTIKVRDSDSIPMAKSIPYTNTPAPRIRDPFRLPREARINPPLAAALNKLRPAFELSEISPAAGE